MQGDTTTITTALPPWTCKAQVYSLFFYGKPDKSAKDGLPPIAYSPLERDSYFASPEAGRFVGGLGSFMVVRYIDTPVGSYDELLVIPGAFAYSKEDKGRSQQKQSPRISRIYVSQEHTLYNGRLSKLCDGDGDGDGTTFWAYCMPPEEAQSRVAGRKR